MSHSAVEAVPWQRLSPRAQETKQKIAPLVADGMTHEEVAGELGIDRREIARAMAELQEEVRSLVEGAALPPLTAEEYTALLDSVDQLGQLVPILLDENGHVIDGAHRMRVCDELEIEPETKTVTGDPHEVRLAVNSVRRTISAATRRQAIDAEIMRDPGRSDRAIAAIVGVSGHTIAQHRAAAEERGQLLRLEHRVGRDGKTQPAHKPKKAPEPTPDIPPEYDGQPAVIETLTLDPNDTTGGRLAFLGKHLVVHVSEHTWMTLDRPVNLRVIVTSVEGRTENG